MLTLQQPNTYCQQSCRQDTQHCIPPILLYILHCYQHWWHTRDQWNHPLPSEYTLLYDLLYMLYVRAYVPLHMHNKEFHSNWMGIYRVFHFVQHMILLSHFQPPLMLTTGPRIGVGAATTSSFSVSLLLLYCSMREEMTWIKVMFISPASYHWIGDMSSCSQWTNKGVQNEILFSPLKYFRMLFVCGVSCTPQSVLQLFATILLFCPRSQNKLKF